MVLYLAIRASQKDWEQITANYNLGRSKFWRSYALIELPEKEPMKALEMLKALCCDQPTVLVSAANNQRDSPIANFQSRRGPYMDPQSGAMADVLDKDWNEHPDGDPDLTQAAVIVGINFSSALSLYANICRGTAEIDTSRQKASKGWAWTLLHSTEKHLDQTKFPEAVFDPDNLFYTPYVAM